MKERVLIRGGCVLTLGVKTPNFALADVLIDSGRVVEVGRGLRARDAEQVDATDTIVMPGFVDTHRHFWESLFRNVGSEPAGTSDDYGPHFRPDDVYAATLIGLLGAIDAGITTAVDWCEVGGGQDHVNAALQAHFDSGIRSVFAYGASAWSEGEWTSGLRRLVQGADRPLLTLAAGPHKRPGREEAIASEWALARELGLRIHAHTGSLREVGAAFDEATRKLLDKDVTLIHCANLTDPDLDAVASSGAAVSLTPSSEMAGGRGSLPIQKLIDRGIRPGLGVDTERVAPGDLFAQMRAAISLQHATSFDLKLAGKAGLPRLLTTREVIRFATVDGARVAGVGAETGTLEIGMQADLVLLRTDRPNISPVNDPIGAVVWGMDTSNVDWVFVAGRPLKTNGVIDGDINGASALANAARQRVMDATGLFAGARGGGG